MAKDAAGDRLPWFRFFPRDFMADPEVQALSCADKGRYFWALCCSWENHTPGRATAAQWARWMRVTEAIFIRRLSALFVDDSGIFVQKRLVEEHANSLSVQEHGRKGARARWDARALPGECYPQAQPQAQAEKKESTHLFTSSVNGHTNGVSLNGHGRRQDPVLVEWEATFNDWFWPSYWRKVSKPAALKAWMKIDPKTQETVDAVGAGLARQGGTIQSRDPEKRPHASTWLNNRRWEDPDA